MNRNAVKTDVDVPRSSLFLSSFITNFYPILPSPVDTQHSGAAMGPAPQGKSVHFPRSQERRMEKQHDSGLTEKNPNKNQPLSAPQFWAFLSSPPFFTGLSLQADHVPEYHRSSSSHSLRSCNLLRPQCQKAAPPLVVVYSSFFNIFGNGRGAQTGCYHHTHFHFAASVAAFNCVSSKLEFNLLCSLLLCPFWDDSWGIGMHL